MLDFNVFHSANATLSGIEMEHMIMRGQLLDEILPAHEQFVALVA